VHTDPQLIILQCTSSGSTITNYTCYALLYDLDPAAVVVLLKRAIVSVLMPNARRISNPCLFHRYSQKIDPSWLKIELTERIH
jgi:hypothetical protein